LRVCKLCDPRNKKWSDRIKELYLQGLTRKNIIKQLEAEGFHTYPAMISRHLKHLKLFQGMEPTEEERRQEVNVLAEIERNYTLLRNMTSQAMSMDWADPATLQAIRAIMTESRECLETIQKLKERVLDQQEFSRENVVREVIKILKDIPDEALLKVVNHLEQSEKRDIQSS